MTQGSKKIGAMTVGLSRGETPAGTQEAQKVFAKVIREYNALAKTVRYGIGGLNPHDYSDETRHEGVQKEYEELKKDLSNVLNGIASLHWQLLRKHLGER